MTWTAEAVIALVALFATLILAATQMLMHSREKTADRERKEYSERLKACEAHHVEADKRIHDADVFAKGLEGQVNVARAEHQGIAAAVERLTKSLEERMERVENKVDEVLRTGAKRSRKQS